MTSWFSRFSMLLITANVNVYATEFAPVKSCFVGSGDCSSWTSSDGERTRDAGRDVFVLKDDDASPVFPLLNNTFVVEVNPHWRGSSPVDVIFMEDDRGLASDLLVVRLMEDEAKTSQAFLCLGSHQGAEEVTLLGTSQRNCHKMMVYETYHRMYKKYAGQEYDLNVTVLHDSGEVIILKRVKNRELMKLTVFYRLYNISYFTVSTAGSLRIPMPHLRLTERNPEIVSSWTKTQESQFVCVAVSGVVEMRSRRSLHDSLELTVRTSEQYLPSAMQRCRKQSAPWVEYFTRLNTSKIHHFKIHIKSKVTECDVYVTKISSCRCNLPDLKHTPKTFIHSPVVPKQTTQSVESKDFSNLYSLFPVSTVKESQATEAGVPMLPNTTTEVIMASVETSVADNSTTPNKVIGETISAPYKSDTSDELSTYGVTLNTNDTSTGGSSVSLKQVADEGTTTAHYQTSVGQLNTSHYSSEDATIEKPYTTSGVQITILNTTAEEQSTKITIRSTDILSTSTTEMSEGQTNLPLNEVSARESIAHLSTVLDEETGITSQYGTSDASTGISYETSYEDRSSASETSMSTAVSETNVYEVTAEESTTVLTEVTDGRTAGFNETPDGSRITSLHEVLSTEIVTTPYDIFDDRSSTNQYGNSDIQTSITFTETVGEESTTNQLETSEAVSANPNKT